MLTQSPQTPVQGQPYQVCAHQYPVLFADKTSVVLHEVWARGQRMPNLRATLIGKLLIIFDVTRLLDRRFALELAQAREQDVTGIVMFALRDRFKTAVELQACAVLKVQAALICKEAGTATAPPTPPAFAYPSGKADPFEHLSPARPFIATAEGTVAA